MPWARQRPLKAWSKIWDRMMPLESSGDSDRNLVRNILIPAASRICLYSLWNHLVFCMNDLSVVLWPSSKHDKYGQAYYQCHLFIEFKQLTLNRRWMFIIRSSFFIGNGLRLMILCHILLNKIDSYGIYFRVNTIWIYFARSHDLTFQWDSRGFLTIFSIST